MQGCDPLVDRKVILVNCKKLNQLDFIGVCYT